MKWLKKSCFLSARLYRNKHPFLRVFFLGQDKRKEENDEKTALITGASGGIGLATARKLASEGYDLILHYYRNKEPLERLKDDLPVQCRIVQADLSHPTGPDTLMEQGSAADLLILNSGKSRFGLMTDLNDDEIDELVQLHITSPYKIAQKAIPSMVLKKAEIL